MHLAHHRRFGWLARFHGPAREEVVELIGEPPLDEGHHAVLDEQRRDPAERMRGHDSRR